MGQLIIGRCHESETFFLVTTYPITWLIRFWPILTHLVHTSILAPGEGATRRRRRRLALGARLDIDEPHGEPGVEVDAVEPLPVQAAPIPFEAEPIPQLIPYVPSLNVFSTHLVSACPSTRSTPCTILVIFVRPSPTPPSFLIKLGLLTLPSRRLPQTS